VRAKSLLSQQTLASPQGPFTGQQALPLQGGYRLEEHPFAVIMRIVTQDVLESLRMAYEVQWVRPAGQTHHIAKLGTEGQILGERVTLQSLDALFKDTPSWAGGVLDVCVSCHEALTDLPTRHYSNMPPQALVGATRRGAHRHCSLTPGRRQNVRQRVP
jgi:hypothetical protein